MKVLQAFANENQFRKISGNFTIKSAADYTPKPGDDDYRPKDDAPWLKRFADDEGRVVISGDVRMRYRPHERLALIEHKFLVIFFENQWSEWKFWRKTALLIHWWPIIASKITRHKKPSFFHVPCNWVEGGELRWVSNKDPKELKLEQRVKAAKRKKAKAPPVAAGDGPLFDYAKKKPRRKK